MPHAPHRSLSFLNEFLKFAITFWSSVQVAPHEIASSSTFAGIILKPKWYWLCYSIPWPRKWEHGSSVHRPSLVACSKTAEPIFIVDRDVTQFPHLQPPISMLQHEMMVRPLIILQDLVDKTFSTRNESIKFEMKFVHGILHASWYKIRRPSSMRSHSLTSKMWNVRI